MEITPRLRKRPKHFGSMVRPSTYDCKTDCYGDFPASEWQVGWLMGAVLNDNGVLAKGPVVSFTATWEVPAIPLDPIAEVYLFTQLQSNNYIIQPCLLFYPGPNQWFIQSVMYSENKKPIYGELFPVSAGELIKGVIEQYDGKWVIITSSESTQHRSICSLPIAEVGPILPGFGGLTLESYMLNNQNTANQLPGTSCMWFDMNVRVLGHPVDISWTPWLSDCIVNNCFPWLNLGEGVTMLDSGTALMKFGGNQEPSATAKKNISVHNIR